MLKVFSKVHIHYLHIFKWLATHFLCIPWIPLWNSFSHVQLFATPRTDQFMEFLRPEYRSRLPFPSPGDLPNPGIQPRSPALQTESLPAEPPGKHMDPSHLCIAQIQHAGVLLSLLFSLCRVLLFAAPWTAARQASLSFTTSQTLLKLMSIGLVMPSNHLILCHSLSSSTQSFPASGSFPVSRHFTSGD